MHRKNYFFPVEAHLADAVLSVHCFELAVSVVNLVSVLVLLLFKVGCSHILVLLSRATLDFEG